jgi:Na+-transporting methylmalonyl-CoA/oxaloacetate decarboxylase gamma subunit
MLRFLLILGILVYVFYKIGSFFFRAGAAAQELKDFKQQRKTPQPKKNKVNGGEYVDYEEIKINK